MSKRVGRPAVSGNGTSRSALAQFETVYRANVGGVSAFFARRYADPQTVADLTSETFVQAIGSFGSFDPGRGSVRGWLFGIARRVNAQHREGAIKGQDAAGRLAGRRQLAGDDVGELEARIDAEQAGRVLLARCERLSAVERAAIELVDLAGLTASEAADVLNVSPGALRIRLFRARARLRKERVPQ